jgi:hypothetical protein
MVTGSRVSVILVAMATAAFVGSRRADLAATCCFNTPPQCEAGGTCYDNGWCANCLNMCSNSGGNCNWIACDRC